jgi:predicted nucleic acid-binding Zn ribbon protein
MSYIITCAKCGISCEKTQPAIYCSRQCKQNALRKRNALKGYYTKPAIQSDKFCIVCKIQLPKYRKRFCSHACEYINDSVRRRSHTRPPRITFCETCNADISWRGPNARYCSRKCSPNYRQHVQKGAKKHNRLVRAAYAAFRELTGEYGKLYPKATSPELLPGRLFDWRTSCVICGTVLTGQHIRMCGSQWCRNMRERKRRELIAAGKYTFPGKNRKPNNNRKSFNEKHRIQRQRQYAAYVAMRELNLLPTMENR